MSVLNLRRWAAALLPICFVACASAPPAPSGRVGCEPVIMVVSGVTLDRERMQAYAQALAESGLYDRTGGYYLNAPRPLEVFEGEPPDDYVALMVRFPSLEAARAFWYDPHYQSQIKPMRLNPSAGDYDVIVYREADLPERMRGRVAPATFRDAEWGCSR